ncbi:hypothetical protein [Paenibacillus arenilitoris]|uniref:Uncharacterized protein n=1 Tax=Paenibacillus arenilitoris TaxID=2772299 RepID=A0A927CNZ1_9BACL|nr:hypothetical protein [Paenibacillus arenilitoris]MBD2870807.1 hypothetical protein [Paenibacillus arenilitoris]
MANRFSDYAYEQIGAFNREAIRKSVERTEFVLSKLKSYSLNMYAEALRALTKYLSTEPYIEDAFLIHTRFEKSISNFRNLAAGLPATSLRTENTAHWIGMTRHG